MELGLAIGGAGVGHGAGREAHRGREVGEDEGRAEVGGGGGHPLLHVEEDLVPERPALRGRQGSPARERLRPEEAQREGEEHEVRAELDERVGVAGGDDRLKVLAIGGDPALGAEAGGRGLRLDMARQEVQGEVREVRDPDPLPGL